MHLLTDTVTERKKVFLINRFTITSIEYIDFSVCNIVLLKSSVGEKNQFISHDLLTDEKLPKS